MVVHVAKQTKHVELAMFSARPEEVRMPLRCSDATASSPLRLLSGPFRRVQRYFAGSSGNLLTRL